MGEHFHPAEKFARNFIRLNAKEVLNLRARNDHGNAIRETHHHRARYEFNDGAQARGSQDYQQYPRQQRAHEKAVQPILRDDPVHDHHEGPSRTSYLRRRASQRRNQKARHNRAVKPSLRSYP